MATSAPTWSRPHRQGAGDVQLTGIYHQLVENWTHMSALPSMANQMRKWAATHPILEGTTSLPDLLDRIDAAPAAEKDAIFVALISLAQEGKQIPAQVVLQAMLPKLSNMAYSANMIGSDATDLEERRHIGVAAFLEVVAAFPVDRRTTKVAANLSLDTLHALTAGTRAIATEYPVTMSGFGVEREAAHELVGELFDQPIEPITFDDVDASQDPTGNRVINTVGGSPNPDGDLLEVVAWGIDSQTISADEAALLVQVYAPAVGEEGGHAAVAAKLGVKAATVRQRCSRATRALAAAVRAEADGSWLDSPATFA